MVSFTCNACGQTVKKSKVEKHYQTECRDCSVLSCLDCGKDFHGDEYASHTSCISEAEKYQGKLYKDSNRGQPPKGEKKQQVWLEKVKQAAVSSPATNPRLARLLDKLQEYSNIPRKMKKFQNFVKNSLNVRDQKTLDELWSMFSGIQAGSTGADADKTAETCTMEDSTIAVDDQVEADKVKKKKKKRSEMDDSETTPSVLVDEESVVDVEEDILSSTKKHKKKKHHHIRESEDITTNTNQLDIQLLSDSQPPVAVEESVSKKKKKSKKKSSEQEARCVSDELDTVEDGQGTDNGVEENINHWVSSITDSAAVNKKKKKDKHKHCEVTDDSAGTGLDGCNDDESTMMSTDVSHKDNKKKSKSKKRDINVDPDQVVMEDNEVTVVEQKKKKKRKASTEDVPVEKKTKLVQIGDDETELPSVKKHKKKKLVE